jgi:hypothetical protein
VNHFPVTITLGTATNPAPLIGLQSFRVGPISTNFTAALLLTGKPGSLLVESTAPGEHTVERSADLHTWEPIISIFTTLESFKLSDRSTKLLFSNPGESSFPATPLRYRQNRLARRVERERSNPIPIHVPLLREHRE